MVTSAINTTRIKICGLRTAEAAWIAANAGADYLGFDFSEEEPGRLKAFEGQAVIRNYRTRGDRRNRRRNLGPRLVGLFRDQESSWINHVARQLDIDNVQLCGEEDEAYARKIHKGILRQITVEPSVNASALSKSTQQELEAGRTVVLKVRGKAGRETAEMKFDWSLVEGLASREHVILAGGLTPDIVAEVMRHVQPWGVEYSIDHSQEPARNHEMIRAFIEAVRSLDG